MPFLRTAVERRWALSGLLNERAGELNPIGMREKNSINYRSIAAALAEKYKKTESAVSSRDHGYWLELYYATGEEIRNIEGRVRRLDRHLQLFSRFLKSEFPDAKKERFSPGNLKRMRTFFLMYRDFRNAVIWEAVCQLSWQHHIRHLCRIEASEQRLFYLLTAAAHDWSCQTLSREIRQDHFGRIGMPSNFAATLPGDLSQSARLIFKKAYVFAFVAGKKKLTEKDLEVAFVDNIQDFLRELGPGFAFKSRQQRMKFGAREYVCDLVLYHTDLKCHIVIDVKRGEFRPEYISKMDRYLTCADKKFKGKDDNDTIGMVLCMSKDDQIVEDALKSSYHPIGVALCCIEN